MSDLSEFRADVRAWLETNCPKDKRGRSTEADGCFGGRHWKFKDENQRLWLERMAARGWTAPEWPKEYGGGGLTGAQAIVLREEMKRIEAFDPLLSLGIWMLGPALLKFGTEEQKKKYLPPIVRGETWWCQGYSEPNAGSDLVSLQTRAVREGDEFVITGQKIWTSYGHLADSMFCLVRTSPDKPRHDGISFLLIDEMNVPEIKRSPLRQISGNEHFSQIFFDGVRVPAKNLVGQLDRGWDVAKYLLQFERAMIGGARQSGSTSVTRFALKHLGAEAVRAEPMLRAQIAEMDMEFAAFECMLQRYQEEAAAGHNLGAKFSMLKYLGSELGVKKSELMVTLLGMAGIDRDGPEGKAAFDWLSSFASRIGGGTSEINLNVVAKRVLELPGG